MRSRKESGARLDFYRRLLSSTILSRQDPVTGLVPADEKTSHAWIRDNVYCVLSVWGLSMAYKKESDMDEERARAFELEQSCVKLMRGLLGAMMRQRDKLERFKVTQAPLDALHAKYSSETGAAVVGDSEWGHLQIDAVSLFLLILAQLTAAGLQIVFDLDEVAFVQNLVFYIEVAYCIPDYGMWERGDKGNHGLPELNATSIGTAKAALEAMNELDLFGARGGPASVIHILADEAEKCRAVLHSILPRESNSKEVDSGLLSVISFPAFAVDDAGLIAITRSTISEKLEGKFGFKRFLRDGYKTSREDPTRLYYEPWELRIFEGIECEWPLFYCYSLIDAAFRADEEASRKYSAALARVIVKDEEGLPLIPEFYAVPPERVNEEYARPGSQTRCPLGRTPFLWAQSLFILAMLLQEDFLAPGELDPLNRRLCSEKKPDVVVQVVVLAEDAEIQEKLKNADVHVQTVREVGRVEVLPARVLSHLYTFLGRSGKLGLSGRPSRDVGILCTSKLYSLGERLFAFTPQLMDQRRFYLASDYELMIDNFKNELNFLKSSWQGVLGRPLVVFTFRHIHLEDGRVPYSIVTTMKKLRSGYTVGTRVALGSLADFLSTSCVTNLSFLGSIEDGFPHRLEPAVSSYLEQDFLSGRPTGHLCGRTLAGKMSRRLSLRGTIRRTRSLYRGESELGSWKEAPTRSPSPELLPPRQRSVKHPHWDKTESDAQFDSFVVEDVVGLLRETESLEEQGDILHYLVVTYGLQYEPQAGIKVKDLLKTLHEKACTQKSWGLVRHTAGMLEKRVEDLAKSVTDLVVRQKQLTVGMPPDGERTIVGPLPEGELRQLIREAYGSDESTAMLTQELLVYVAMLIRTEPELFAEMLRLRLGLLIQVMASELGRSLQCPGREASDHLLNLSPFAMKKLLYQILSGKESMVSTWRSGGNLSNHSAGSHNMSRKLSIASRHGELEVRDEQETGQWIRRRRVDGALNRVPRGFYPRVWAVLERCSALGLSGNLLPNSLTQEMTSGELKFALRVEGVLNSVPYPEYRQLIVEALMVLTLIVDHGGVSHVGDTVAVDAIVKKANALFVADQVSAGGDGAECCGGKEESCEGPGGICIHFYDSPPSGSHGTMTYLAKALAESLISQDQSSCTLV